MDASLVLQIEDVLPYPELWGSALGFIILWCAVIFGIGLLAENLAIGAAGAYMAFSIFALETDVAVLEPLWMSTLVLIVIGMAFKLWRLEGLGVGT